MESASGKRSGLWGIEIDSAGFFWTSSSETRKRWKPFTAETRRATVDVEIRSGERLVLQGRCEGPLMLVDLPSDGSYEVRARAPGGGEQRKTVRIGGAQPARATFTWPGS